VGSEPPIVGSQGSRTEHTRALNRTQARVRCRHVSRPDLVGSGPSYTPMLPVQAETRCCHVAYCTRRKPTDEAWHKASGLRASLHLLRIRRAHVHCSDRRHAQSTLRGPCCYSHVTIARTMTHHYSRVTKKRVTAYQCCMDCSHHDSR
jgi:hypothetical protein